MSNPVMSRQEMQAIIEKVVRWSRADEVQVNLNSNVTGNTRFAANQLSTSGSVEDANIAVSSAFGPKHAVVTSNDLSDDSLHRLVSQSEALARLAPDDPEAMPSLGPQTYQPVNAFFDSTANLAPGDRARAALTALEQTRAAGDLMAAGFIVTQANSGAIGNQAGLFAYHRNTSANYTLTVRTADGTGSGWAAADSQDWSQLDFRGVAQRAVDKARASRNPVAIEPGRYTVILEPQAAGDLVQLMAFSLDARSADEGRSAFTREGGGTKIGERIVDERVTIFSDPRDPQLLAQPFDGQGLPLGRQGWVENGVLRQLFYSRFWAQRQNQQPTGFPSGVKLAGGTATVDEMVASTERGVLVTRLWYLRQVDPRTILYTGLTRDGTFLIENGRISRSVRNFRFNDSPLFMLNNLDTLGRAERLAGTEAGGDIVMPAIKVHDFNFTSLSEAV
ncbi:MAG: TldD/PmbA family protein [Gemmatimonadales bacterium]|nr:TldD/PmbA family protein [Gemmatimonadales bacterium]